MACKQNLDLRCVLISDPGTLGAGAKTRLESRIKKFTPHCIYRHTETLMSKRMILFSPLFRNAGPIGKLIRPSTCLFSCVWWTTQSTHRTCPHTKLHGMHLLVFIPFRLRRVKMALKCLKYIDDSGNSPDTDWADSLGMYADCFPVELPDGERKPPFAQVVVIVLVFLCLLLLSHHSGTTALLWSAWSHSGTAALLCSPLVCMVCGRLARR